MVYTTEESKHGVKPRGNPLVKKTSKIEYEEFKLH